MPFEALLICNMGNPNSQNNNTNTGEDPAQSDLSPLTHTWTLSVLNGVQLIPITPASADGVTDNNLGDLNQTDF